MTGRSFLYQQPWLVLDAEGFELTVSRQHGLVGLQVLELRKAKHCFAQVAACEANASKELSLELAESCAEICNGFREGKLQGRNHKMLQLSLRPLHQHCYACVKETTTTPNAPIPFWDSDSPRANQAHLTYPENSPPLHLVPAVAG